MVEELDTLCPVCGNRTLVKMYLPDGKYTIVCKTCGMKRGELEPDDKKGVV
jgi:uncharacterized protein (DUF983 family)